MIRAYHLHEYYIPNNRNHWLVSNDIRPAKAYASFIDQANYRSFDRTLECYENTPGIEKHRDYWLVHPWRKDVIEVIEDMESGLNNYPLIDDDAEDYYEELKQETIADYLPDALRDFEWMVSDYLATFKGFESVEIEPTDEELYALFELACDRQGYGIELDSTDSAYIDVDRLKKYLSLIDIITDIEIVKLPSLEDVPHSVFHDCIKHHRRGFYDLNGELLELPDFITLQYDRKQVPLF